MLAFLVVACGSTAPTPVDVVNNYLSGLAEGNYAGACAMLSPQARAALQTSTGLRAPCHTVFARCLPNKATILNKDQSQLFYATISITGQGSSAVDAKVSGTAVADVLKEITLEQVRGNWQLSSYGKGLKGCPAGRRRR